jgi:hypothetical protein
MSTTRQAARDLADGRGWWELSLILGALAYWWIATRGG